jgi:hypothetical protein
MIGAFNFSCFECHDRKDMLQYAKSALRSLKTKGTLFLEIAGGPGFTEPHQDTRMIRVPGVGRVKQIWEQHPFDPITSIGDYSIHFKFSDGSGINDAFTYHWRIWNIRELREILEEAGFKKTIVLWETRELNGEGSGEFLPLENTEALHSFIAYIVAVK